MQEADIKKIVDSEIKKFVKEMLDAEMKKILHNSNSASRDEMIKTIKDALDSVFRGLWQKKSFWQENIK